MTTSVRPSRVPRQPRGPAPNGSQQRFDGAPPVDGLVSQRSGMKSSACGPQLVGSRPRAYGEKHSVEPLGTATSPTFFAAVEVRPTNGTLRQRPERRVSGDSRRREGETRRQHAEATGVKVRLVWRRRRCTGRKSEATGAEIRAQMGSSRRIEAQNLSGDGSHRRQLTLDLLQTEAKHVDVSELTTRVSEGGSVSRLVKQEECRCDGRCCLPPCKQQACVSGCGCDRRGGRKRPSVRVYASLRCIRQHRNRARCERTVSEPAMTKSKSTNLMSSSERDPSLTRSESRSARSAALPSIPLSRPPSILRLSLMTSATRRRNLGSSSSTTFASHGDSEGANEMIKQRSSC